MVGVVLCVPDVNEFYYTFTAVPDNVVDDWLPLKQRIHVTELFAGPLALDSFEKLFKDKHIIHFLDNSAALGCLVKGYSKVQDFLKTACELQPSKLLFSATGSRVKATYQTTLPGSM